MTVTVHHGDCREVLRSLPPESVQCCVTSPPYFGLRNYNVDGQIGLEQTPDAYVAELVEVFRGVRNAIRNDGTVWLNLGDSMRDKHLLGIPWRVAFALQADGWWLRSAIVWHKPRPMPESCKDRPTSAYEMVFLLTKQSTYFYDADAIREPHSPMTTDTPQRRRMIAAGKFSRESEKKRVHTGELGGTGEWMLRINPNGANSRNVWTIATKPFRGAHFATMPPDLVERCIKAGSRPGDTIIDPFGGAGTTGLVANRLGRNAVLIELNREYCDMAIRRINDASPLFANVA